MSFWRIWLKTCTKNSHQRNDWKNLEFQSSIMVVTFLFFCWYENLSFETVFCSTRTTHTFMKILPTQWMPSWVPWNDETFSLKTSPFRRWFYAGFHLHTVLQLIPRRLGSGLILGVSGVVVEPKHLRKTCDRQYGFIFPSFLVRKSPKNNQTKRLKPPPSKQCVINLDSLLKMYENHGEHITHRTISVITSLPETQHFCLVNLKLIG